MARPTINSIWGSTGVSVDPGVSGINSGWAAVIPTFETQNYWQERVDLLLKNIEELGIMEWSTDTTYKVGSWVTASDNDIYKSLTGTNKGNDPISSPIHWKSFNTVVAVSDATTSTKGIIELATVPEAQLGTDAVRAITPYTLKESVHQALGSATTGTKGEVQLASSSETQVGSNSTKAVTPSGLKTLTALESRAGLAQKASNSEVSIGTNDSKFITPKQLADNGVPQATTSVQGKIEIATRSEVAAGVDQTRAVTPHNLGSFMAGWIFPMPVISAPVGFLEAAGTLRSRTTYPDLWAWVQTNAHMVTESEWSNGAKGAYTAGDGSTNFRLPDLRGVFIRGWDNGAGIDTGRTLGSYQADDFKNHHHNVTAARKIGGYTDNGGAPDERSIEITFDSSSVGGTETRPKNVALMYCIKF